MDTSEQRRRPADTQELLAMWSAAKEQHFVQELVPLLPPLLGSSDKLDRKQTEEAARHLVRALHLAARPEGGIHAALDYLTKMVEGKDPANLE
jgi:hypothetical protein